jgi:electron transfer flavoprotein alpha subunit
MKLLLILEHKSGQLSRSAFANISAANKLCDLWDITERSILLLGSGAAQAAATISKVGYSKIYFSEATELVNASAPVLSQIVSDLVAKDDVDVVCGGATNWAKDFFPRLASAISAGQASDIVDVNKAEDVLVRPTYAGDLLAKVKILTTKKVVTFRSSAFIPLDIATECAGHDSTPCEELDLSATLAKLNNKHYGEFINFEEVASERPELGNASVVVSGGVSLKSTENFEKYIFPLADALGGAVGASRAAVDAGYVPNDWQVGQTGKVVAPDLYIAVGISGAIQHLAGMKDSKCVVAINKDKDAPIFEVADYGLVGDLFEVVPELTKLINARKS